MVVDSKKARPVVLPKPGDVPRWIKDTEACIACNKQAKLVSHHINIENPQTAVEIHYHCDHCGYDSRWHYQERFVESYQKYLDEKRKLDNPAVS